MNDAEEREIRAILADLQDEIHRHRLALGEAGAVSPPNPMMRVREKQAVNPHLPIGWPVMPRGIVAKLIAYAQKITRRLLRWYINPIVAQQNAFNAAITDLCALLQSSSEEHAQRLQVLEGQGLDTRLLQLQETYGAQLEQLRGTYDAQFVQLQRRIESEQEITRLRLQRLESRNREHETSTPSPAAHPPRPAIDYFLLGAYYRNPSQMAARLDDYDDLFRPLRDAAGELPASRLPVLDIGCGRGEFVAHLISLGLPAYGIDLDVDALAIGQGQGLDLRQADALAHLQSLPDDSLAAVAMIQVIEHFEPEAALHLLQLVARKLAPGGFIVVETLNPTCLHALTNWYLMDPSHRMPMHYETTRFLMMQAGLHRIGIRFLHPVPEDERLQSISPRPEGQDAALATMAAQLRYNTEQLNRFLYGPQDYAAVAYKPES